MTRFYLFTKDSCGPCGLVKKYFNSLNDNRIKVIQEIKLEDFNGKPISEKNFALAKKFNVTAAPVLVVADDNDNILEPYVGGLPITQNIRKLFDKYDV